MFDQCGETNAVSTVWLTNQHYFTCVALTSAFAKAFWPMDFIVLSTLAYKDKMVKPIIFQHSDKLTF